MIHHTILFIAVMLLTVLFLRQVSAEPVQDTENTCHQTHSCKATGSTNNPFEENDDELR